MRRLRTRRLVFRVLIAALALWLPAATGKGGKATCVAAAAFAKSTVEARPHLSCHGEAGAKKKNCCCKGEETLRAAACPCHEGQHAFGTAAHDPMLTSWVAGTARLTNDMDGPALFTRAPHERFADAPDPPPPQASFSRTA